MFIPDPPRILLKGKKVLDPGSATLLFKVFLRVQAMLLQSSLLKKLFLISGEKQSESAPTDISLPGVQKNIMNKFMQYIYQVIFTLSQLPNHYKP
jgi:hypothetical protein